MHGAHLVHGTAASDSGATCSPRVAERARRRSTTTGALLRDSSGGEPLADLSVHARRRGRPPLEGKGGGPAIVVGWSIGGVIALELALERPRARPLELVLVEPALHIKKRPSPRVVRAVDTSRAGPATGLGGRDATARPPPSASCAGRLRVATAARASNGCRPPSPRGNRRQRGGVAREIDGARASALTRTRSAGPRRRRGSCVATRAARCSPTRRSALPTSSRARCWSTWRAAGTSSRSMRRRRSRRASARRRVLGSATEQAEPIGPLVG